jgi:hypothetical protein
MIVIQPNALGILTAGIRHIFTLLHKPFGIRSPIRGMPIRRHIPSPQFTYIALQLQFHRTEFRQQHHAQDGQQTNIDDASSSRPGGCGFASRISTADIVAATRPSRTGIRQGGQRISRGLLVVSGTARDGIAPSHGILVFYGFVVVALFGFFTLSAKTAEGERVHRGEGAELVGFFGGEGVFRVVHLWIWMQAVLVVVEDRGRMIL